LNKNLENIINDLNKLKTIPERLNYLEQNVYSKYEFTRSYWDENQKRIPDPIFDDFETESTVTLLKIPNEIHDKYFKNGHKDIEYCCWFLKFNAKFYSKRSLIPHFEKKSDNPLKSDFLVAEINELLKLEKQATADFLEKKFDIYKRNIDPLFEKQIILKRIQSNYYERNILEYVHTFGDRTVMTFAQHIYFKSYLIEELKRENIEQYQKLFNNSKISSFESILVKSIKDLSIKPKIFKDEDEIRSHFYYIISALSNNTYVTIESLSRKGRTDLLVSGEYGRIIVEFKIWKRNNYKKIVNQLIGYLSDFESEGYIVILNKQQKLIEKEYIQTISDEQTFIIGEVTKLKLKDTNYEYYRSTHKIDLKPKTVTHFIYNEIQ
jgi:hypothetical protein